MRGRNTKTQLLPLPLPNMIFHKSWIQCHNQEIRFVSAFWYEKTNSGDSTNFITDIISPWTGDWQTLSVFWSTIVTRLLIRFCFLVSPVTYLVVLWSLNCCFSETLAIIMISYLHEQYADILYCYEYWVSDAAPSPREYLTLFPDRRESNVSLFSGVSWRIQETSRV